MLESKYQAELIKTLKRRFPDCTVIKNDSNYLQGIPDLLLLWHEFWAMLEVKVDDDYNVEPNQEYYIHRFHQMSYAAFIHPGNEEEVLDEIQSTFTARRKTRVSKR